MDIDERRRNRQNETKFATLIASPFNMAGGALILPANADLAYSYSVNLSASTLSLSLQNGRVIKNKALIAGVKTRFGWFERAFKITPSCAVAGTLSIYLAQGLGRYALIATRIFP